MRLPILMLALCAALPLAHAADDTVWFVVAETEQQTGESFLLPLRDPAAIAEARLFLADRDSGVGSIAVARIAAGGDGFNRDVRGDVRGEGQPLWSWHVTEFLGFQDLAIEICDGWPGYIEQDPERFIANTDGVLCLWGYEVVAELEQPPQFHVGEGLDGAWYEPRTSGQGVFLDVLPGEQPQVAMGWFTWRIDGGDGPLWLTALGPLDGTSATMALHASTGGRFNDPAPVTTLPIGSAVLVFDGCDHARLHYELDTGHSGDVALVRVVPRPGCHLR